MIKKEELWILYTLKYKNYKKLYANTFELLNTMDKFLEKKILPNEVQKK